METLQLKVTKISPPIPLKGVEYQVRKKENDQGDIVAEGESIQDAIEKFIDSYESRHDINRRNIKYSWS
jgi:hypothetical protein